MDLFSIGRYAQPSEGKSNNPKQETTRPDLSFPVDRQVCLFDAMADALSLVKH